MEVMKKKKGRGKAAVEGTLFVVVEHHQKGSGTTPYSESQFVLFCL
jgi:hypothetical protein